MIGHVSFDTSHCHFGKQRAAASGALRLSLSFQMTNKKSQLIYDQ